MEGMKGIVSMVFKGFIIILFRQFSDEVDEDRLYEKSRELLSKIDYDEDIYVGVVEFFDDICYGSFCKDHYDGDVTRSILIDYENIYKEWGSSEILFELVFVRTLFHELKHYEEDMAGILPTDDSTSYEEYRSQPHEKRARKSGRRHMVRYFFKECLIN